MLIGVKFCGGCKEGYVREDAFEILVEHFKGRVDFQYVEDDSKYDALLLMSGCPNRCAAIDRYDYNDNLISVWKPSKVDEAISEIEEYLNETGGK